MTKDVRMQQPMQEKGNFYQIKKKGPDAVGRFTGSGPEIQESISSKCQNIIPGI
jgi:hypothetical protein